MNTTRALLLGTTFAVSCFLTACGTTGAVGVRFQKPLDDGNVIEGTFTVGVNGETEAEISSTQPMCLEICFSGSDGASLGCQTVELPASAQVPSGAVHWSANVVDCPGSESTSSTGGASAVQGAPGAWKKKLTPHGEKYWDLLGGNVLPAADGSKNVSYSFHIQANSKAHAEARRDMVLAGGIGTQIGTDFVVVFYNESEAEFDSMGLPIGVRMRQALVDDDFETYRLTVNGLVFAELGVTGTLLHYGASNGWNVVETFVPTSAFGTTPGAYDNQADADWTTTDTGTPWHAMENVYTN